MLVSAGKLFDLSGKVALVTGGSRGLGLEIASGLVEAGAQIAVSARRDSWLVALKDRADALGGTVDVESPAGAAPARGVELPLTG